MYKSKTYQLLIIIFTPWKFFMPGLPSGLSLEFEWQQVFSGFQNSSQYSGKPQQCCCLDSLDSSSNFDFLLSFFQAFCNSSKCTNYNRYHHHPHAPQLFLVLRQGPSICLSFCFHLFTLCGLLGMAKSKRWNILFCCSLFNFQVYFCFLRIFHHVFNKDLACPRSNTPQGTNNMATCLPSQKLSKLDKPDMQVTVGEAGTSS